MLAVIRLKFFNHRFHPLRAGAPDLLHLNLLGTCYESHMDLENHQTSFICIKSSTSSIKTSNIIYIFTNHLFEFQPSHQICRLGFCRDASTCYPTPDLPVTWGRTIKQWGFSIIDFWFLHLPGVKTLGSLIPSIWSRLSHLNRTKSVEVHPSSGPRSFQPH